MSLIEEVIRTRDTIINRDLYLLLGIERKKAWQFFKRLERYNIVKKANSRKVDYWKVVDKDDFLRELKRSIT